MNDFTLISVLPQNLSPTQKLFLEGRPCAVKLFLSFPLLDLILYPSYDGIPGSQSSSSLLAVMYGEVSQSGKTDRIVSFLEHYPRFPDGKLNQR